MRSSFYRDLIGRDGCGKSWLHRAIQSVASRYTDYTDRPPYLQCILRNRSAGSNAEIRKQTGPGSTVTVS